MKRFWVATTIIAGACAAGWQVLKLFDKEIQKRLEEERSKNMYHAGVTTFLKDDQEEKVGNNKA